MKALSPRARATFVLLCFSIVGAALLALTWDLRPYPIPAGVDDYRYVVSAESIAALPGKVIQGVAPLDWLGPYEPTTLFKRPGFSILLGTTSSLHLPYLQTILLLHLVALAIVANSLLRLSFPRGVVFALFVVCGLYPTLYDSNGVRVIRETATSALEIAIIGLSMALFSIGTRRAFDLLYSRAFLALLALLAFHWSMREEAVLLLPAVLLLVNGACWLSDKSSVRSKVIRAAVVSIVLLIPSQLMHFSIARLNRASYGVSLVNDVSEGSFPQAISALKRVEETPCDNRLLAPEEVRKVMEVSPSFRVVGDKILGVLAVQPDMLYGESFASLKTYALPANIAGSAIEPQALFSKITDEVEAACRNGKLHCSARESGGIVPLLCSPRQWRLVPEYFVRYLTEYIAHMSHSGLSPLWSGVPGIARAEPSQVAVFEKITRQKMAGRNGDLAEYSKPASLERLVRQDYRRYQVASIYSTMMPWLMAIGVAGFLIRFLFWRDRTRTLEWVILFTFVVYVLVRVSAFSYLSAVEGYLNTRFIGPCYPMAAIFVVLSAAQLPYLLIRTAARGEESVRTVPLSESLPPAALIVVLLVAGSFVFAGARTGIEITSEPSPASGIGIHVDQGKEVFEWERQLVEVLPDRQGWLRATEPSANGDVIAFNGWGIDIGAKRPAQAILLFANGQFVTSAIPAIPEPSVEQGFPADTHAGFSLNVAAAAVTGKKVRVFALLEGNRAGELNYPPSFPYRD
jgi:hypothetical protein